MRLRNREMAELRPLAPREIAAVSGGITVVGSRGSGSGTFTGGEGWTGNPGGFLGVVGTPEVQAAILAAAGITDLIDEILNDPDRAPIDLDNDGIDDYNGAIIVDGALPGADPAPPPIPGLTDSGPIPLPPINFDLLSAQALDAIDDEAVHVIDTSALGELTPEEQAAVDAFAAKVSEIDTEIKALDDNEVVSTPYGDLTGAEVKEIWAKTDFVINPAGTLYDNGTTNGEANFNGGNPIASFNLDIVKAYGDLANGLNFLILHEVSHFFGPAQAFLNAVGGGTALELFTNDLARALGLALGLSTEFPPGFDPFPGFTPGFPGFAPPPPPPSDPEPLPDPGAGSGSDPNLHLF